jgi:ABC-type lipoprotein export system ATPase subunit
VRHRPAGSIWGKWDLHFHTPSSFDYRNKSISNSQIVQGLIQSGIDAVAITDHHTIDPARIQDLQKEAGDKVTIFPGIELRTELGGSESVHLIGIFPEDADCQILSTKMLGSLNLTKADVASKGDDHIYVKFEEAASLIHELGGIVSVHAGRKTNSLENIKNSELYKQAFKTDLAREHIDLLELGRPEDAQTYVNIVFPKVGFLKPLVICSDNHLITDYVLKAPCWMKGDPCFRTFQQVISDPQERVFVGLTPPAMERVAKNKTKYLKSIAFKKVPGSSLDEIWFSGQIELNHGLIAIIGNKGSGKTALAESIGLLGNTAQHDHFSFLNVAKFQQPKQNKAKHFGAKITWESGDPEEKLLSDPVSSEAVERIGYIPQNYLETICNELKTASESRFDRELKSVIFSHVPDSDRLGTTSLDELLQFRTEPVYARIGQIKRELAAINRKILDLLEQSSPKARQLLLNLHDQKQRELTAHDVTKPSAIPKPETDPKTQAVLEEIAGKIESLKQGRTTRSTTQRTLVAERKTATLRLAVANRVLAKLKNFDSQYKSFLSDLVSDCLELGLNPKKLAELKLDFKTAEEFRDKYGREVTDKAASISAEEDAIADIQSEINGLNEQLDAPNLEYQRHLQAMQEWQERRDEILGTAEEPGTLKYLSKQIANLNDIPAQLKTATEERESKTREIYRNLQAVVETYRTLYQPVQNFIENHKLASERFKLDFEASIIALGLEDSFFALINQGRKGSFSGADEGRRVLRSLVDKADFDSENGAVQFTNELFANLEADHRDYPPSRVNLQDQLRKDISAESLLNVIFSLDYLIPRYSLKWFGKGLDELSPGERGTLLLIFYLLIDRRDIPLIIDQPEENLDNHTVYDVLVPCIKEARQRRQVIIVTHNPNLAVVCDADQVIYCNIDKLKKNAVTYTSGALENPTLNQYTINVLEGTRPAFDQRDSKYLPQ